MERVAELEHSGHAVPHHSALGVAVKEPQLRAPVLFQIVIVPVPHFITFGWDHAEAEKSLGSVRREVSGYSVDPEHGRCYLNQLVQLRIFRYVLDDVFVMADAVGGRVAGAIVEKPLLIDL